MNAATGDRLSLCLGLLVAVAIATWWLGSTQLLLTQGAPTAGAAATALTAAWLTRALVLGPLALRAGALHGWRAATRASGGFVVAVWPLVVAAGAASSQGWWRLALAETTLACATPVLAASGHCIARRFDDRGLAVAVATTLGVVVTATAWWLATRGWTPLSP